MAAKVSRKSSSNRNPMAKELTTRKYKQRVVKDKKKYTRKKLINFTDY